MGKAPQDPQDVARTRNTDVRHNSTHFTRGSQLIGHQMAMFWRGVRMPMIIWVGSFLFIVLFRFNRILDNNEFRMICMRIMAWVFEYIGLDEMKRVNLLLPDNSIRETYIGYVPFIPEVQQAWSKFVSTFWGGIILASGVTGMFTWWFVVAARRRSLGLMEEHHERGAELTTRTHLVKLVEQKAGRELRELARSAYPKMDLDAVMKLPFHERKERGLAMPYRIADVPYPYGREQSHTLFFGSTGTGKTTALRSIIAQAITRQDSAVIFDLTGHYVEAFYDPKRDHILNLTDARCRNWSVFNECDTQAEFVAAAAALIPDHGGSEGGFWELAARTIFIEMCVKLKAEGKGTNKALSDYLLTATLADIYARLKGTIADPLTSAEAARMANSIRGVFNAHGNALRFLPGSGDPFSIRDWVRDEKKGASILFITSRHVDMELNRPLVSMWMNIAIHTLMTLPHTRRLRTWYVFDELGALHKLPSLEDGMQTSRSFGGAFVLGLHNFAKLRMIYGEQGARNIISLAYTKLILAVGDNDTADECSKLIGTREVRVMDEAYSYGAHEARDASTISPSRRDEPLVFPDDIMGLPNMHGFLKFREGYPAAAVQLVRVDYPKIAPGYSPAPAPQPEPLQKPDSETADQGEGSGRGIDPEPRTDAQEGVGASVQTEPFAEAKPSTASPVATPFQLTLLPMLATNAATSQSDAESTALEQIYLSAYADDLYGAATSHGARADAAVRGMEERPASESLNVGDIAKREMAADCGGEDRDKSRDEPMDLDL